MGSKTARGHASENLAARLLRNQGYRILEQNYRARRGEVDIVAQDGEALCFVEVRSRQDAYRGHPVETVDSRKQQRIIHAARQFLARQPHAGPVRFDVLGIVYAPRLSTRLIKGAFECDWSW